MLLTPRYGDRSVLAVDVRSPGDHPVVRQRQRLAGLLADLSEDEWLHPSRCKGWTVQDVVTHLVSTNGFWAFSIQSGVGGAPTQLLAAFDPVATPAQLVQQVKGTSPADTLEQLTTSTEALLAVIEGLDTTGWEAVAEAPPGHLPVRLVADHALWDCWVHERDIVLPLGRTPVVDADEVLTSLRYCAALGRTVQVCMGVGEPDTVVLDVHDPDARVVVTAATDAVRSHDDPTPADALRSEGDAVELLEMLSMRDVGVPPPPAVRHLTAGLSVAFDQAEMA